MSFTRPPISLFGYLAGLVSGLFLAAVTALYLTHAPVPFVNKVQQSTENVTPEPGDPNRSLFSPQIPTAAPDAASAHSSAPVAQPVTPSFANSPAAKLAETLPKAAGTGAGDAAGDAGARLMLQVGAFQNADDADAVRARLALLGLDGKVSATQNPEGTTLYRVRLGPYGQLDDLNGIRRTLSENGMEPQVVHVR